MKVWIRSLLLAGLMALPATAADWKLEVKKTGGTIETVRWLHPKEKSKAAISTTLLDLLRDDAGALRTAAARGVAHAAIVVPEGVITPDSEGGIAVLVPGETVESVAIPFPGERVYLHSAGLFYTRFDVEASRYALMTYSIVDGSSVMLRGDINPVQLKSGKVQIKYEGDSAEVTENGRVTRYQADGGRGKTTGTLKAVTESTRALMAELKAEDLVESAKAGALFSASWVDKYAEAAERRLLAEEGNKRLTLIVGRGNQTALVNRIAERIAKGEAKGLSEWAVYRVNPTLFGPDGFVGGETRKVNEWFDKIAGQKLLIVFENVDKLSILGGDASTTDKKVTGAMAPYLTSSKVLVLATTSPEGLVRMQQDTEFLSAFESVNIPDPNPVEILKIIAGHAKGLAEQGVTFSPEALKAMVFQAHRHLPDEGHPDVEIEGLEAIALERKGGDAVEITPDDIRNWVAVKARRPSLANDVLRKFARPEEFYPAMSEIIGGQRALESVRSLLSQMAEQDRDADTLERKRQGLKIIMFTGPSGTGKTFIVKELEKALAARGIKWPLQTFNGNEYNSERSDWKLLGPPGGFKDSEKPYLFDWARQNPEGLLFFDEFDKLHPNVSKVMMNILDEGVLPSGLTNASFRWRGMIFLAANFGAKGSDQDSYATPEERELAALVNEFTLYFTDDYKFREPDMTKVKKYFANADGQVWPKPKNQKEKDILIGRLNEVLKTEYGRIGRIIDDQLLGRIGVMEVLVHWTKAEFTKLIDNNLKGRVAKYKKESNAEVVFTPAFRQWLIDTTWGQGGRLAFATGARAFVDSAAWNSKVKDRLATAATDAANHGKKWTLDCVDDEIVFKVEDSAPAKAAEKEKSS